MLNERLLNLLQMDFPKRERRKSQQHFIKCHTLEQFGFGFHTFTSDTMGRAITLSLYTLHYHWFPLFCAGIYLFQRHELSNSFYKGIITPRFITEKDKMKLWNSSSSIMLTLFSWNIYALYIFLKEIYF